MTDVERIFGEYKELHRSGGDPDPLPFLARVSGVDQEQLAGLIGAYLARAPRRPFDAAAYRDSPAVAAADATHRAVAGSAGLWPILLPRLRNEARIRRADLVAELAARLGAQSRQDKVALYYHEMEQGRLPAAGVSDTVLDALGRIVGYGKEALRRAGEMPAPGGAAPEAGAVYTRTTRLPEPTDARGARAPEPEEWDEVDRLFRGG